MDYYYEILEFKEQPQNESLGLVVEVTLVDYRYYYNEILVTITIIYYYNENESIKAFSCICSSWLCMVSQDSFVNMSIFWTVRYTADTFECGSTSY